MRAAELKIAQLDPVKDLFEITCLKYSARLREAILEEILNEEKRKTLN